VWTKARILAVKVLFLGLIIACASGPIDYPREYSEAIRGTGDTFLGREVAEWSSQYPGHSGFYPLPRGMDALGARLTLMEQAERSIDAQYFLMKSDEAGLIFAAKMMEAADRGVRVRFLLDDIFTSVDDKGLLLLNSHPNIEVRLFNPLSRNGFYYFNYLGDFKRANRRMHNKSFIVDNQMGVIGGRNIAEEYFELKHDHFFVDFDMLMVGAVAAEVSITFDRFWNHTLSVPMDAFADRHSEAALQEMLQRVYGALEEAGDSAYVQATNSRFVQDVHDELISLYPAKATVVTDDPDKLLNKKSGEFQILVNALTKELEAAESEVVIVTPYLIPGNGGMSLIEELTARGVRVVIFTNSLASTNHIAVHAGYARYRKPLLRAGVELYEARADAGGTVDNHPDAENELLTLHTKGILIDRKIAFIGSLNVDPRSVDINTEMGVLLESTDLAAELARQVHAVLPMISYSVEFDDKDRLLWRTRIDGVEVIETSEPQSGRWRRFKAFMSRILPESQL
jgi:putative cardiolipin synthase